MTIAEEPLLERVTALIDERGDAGGAEQLRAFAAAYLRRTPDDGLDPEAVLREVESAYELLAGRGRRPAVVRAVTGDGTDCPGSVVEATTDDLPYLVDSVSAELQARGLLVRRVVHPIVGTERDHEGHLVRVLRPRDAARRESVMHFELDRRLPPEELAEVEAALLHVLDDVRRVVADGPAMTQMVGRMIEHARLGAGTYPFDEVNETMAFLRWLLEGNFTFLGYREYEASGGMLRVRHGTGLGLLADASTSFVAKDVAISSLRPSIQARVDHGDLLLVTKTNRLSPVHRRTRMDYIGVRFEQGELVGECRLIGLFTTKAYAAPAAETPLLHHKLRRILEAEDLIDGSHDHRNAVAIFGSFPKDELLAANWHDLRAMVVALLAIQADEVRVLVRRSHDERTAAVVVAIPRRRYAAALVDRIQRLLAGSFGDEATIESHLVVDEQFTHARLHFTVHSPDAELPDCDADALEREVTELTRPWDDAVEQLLRRRLGSARAAELGARWFPRFPDFYKAATTPELAAADVQRLEELEESGQDLVVGVQHAEGRSGPRTRLTLYKTGGKVPLSEILPTLEMVGLRVHDERPTRLLGGDGKTFVQNFGVLGPDGRPLDLEELADRLSDTIMAVRAGGTDADWLSELVLVAGLTWEQVGMLRAYRVYRQRAGARFGLRYDGQAFAAQPHVAVKLVRYFELRHGPEADEAAADALREEILADLDAVESLDQDRILRDQLTLVDATLRTNAFRPGRDAMAIKLRSADIPGLPSPRPHVEVFVHSVAMEGIHLRGGAIARGGIRWSDRLDFRTEVYGLMRAQMTKNAVIVPTGAKGGFYLKQRPADPDQLKAEVARQYERYIRALLDITDNIVDGHVVHPDGVCVHDGEDPYLVVAADKGTATFSDTANRIAAEYGFWLGDAFASGGSEGYDHKKLGITARGAWESVRRHFRELNMDPERDPITVVGIGDMSGDVFGNGLLLSRTARLIAAYDHRHVFVDPDPADAEAAWQERKRLFDLGQAGGSSWDDYDRSLISAGGGVWPRRAKSVPLSPEVRTALGVEAERLTPDELIRAILRAPVDLLFNGGIGTVVKAAGETDGDAHDRASDAIRVDAADLRCRVVGEGGNLGFTQRGRIELSAGGGRINADFIDNSAGVDCSDHEVNLKILLDLAVSKGELDAGGRHELLVKVTDDVTTHVLQDSYRQARVLSREVVISGRRLYAYEDLMAALEERKLLDREADALPGPQSLGQRRRSGHGLHRPELAVLLAHAKRSLTDDLLHSPLLDEPWLHRDLESYFPSAVTSRLGHLLPEHRLRRELLATLVANDVVDALGPSFVNRLATELGASPPDVVRAYRIARDVVGAVGRFAAIDSLDAALAPEVEAELVDGVERLVEGVTRWYLLHRVPGPLQDVIEAGHEGFDALEDALEGAREDGVAPVVDRLRAQGVPETIGLAHALAPDLVLAPDVIAVAEQTGRSLEEVGELFALLGSRLRFGWLETELDELGMTQRVQRWAVSALRDDARRARRHLAMRALTAFPDRSPADTAEAFAEANRERTGHLSAVMRSLSVDGTDLAGLMVVVRELRAIGE
jgi:glutamate dehydrogenase